MRDIKTLKISSSLISPRYIDSDLPYNHPVLNHFRPLRERRRLNTDP